MKMLGALAPGWRTVRFGDVVRNVDEAVRDPLTCGLERFVGLEHIDPEALRIKRWGLITDGTSFTRKFTAGQVLFGKRRAYQRKVAVADFDGLCSSDILVFEPADDQLLPELLPFIVQTEGFFQHALGTSAGSLSPRTRWRDLAAYEFPLPPLDEQRRIAEILWAAEEGAVSYEKVLHDLINLWQAYREQVVWAPEYHRAKLGTCLTRIVAGKSVLGANRPASDNEHGVLKVSAVGEFGFVSTETKALLDQNDFIMRYKVGAGDLLITRANTRELVGRVCAVPQDFPDLMLSDKTLRLETDPERIDRRFLLHALQGAQVRSQIEALASGTGGAMKNISQDDIRSLLVPLPERALQDGISRVLERLELALERTRRYLAQYRQTCTELTNRLLLSDGL